MAEVKKIATKTYTITVEVFDDGTQNMKRTNDGFGTLELIGMLDFSKNEVTEILKNNTEYAVVHREVITRKNETEITESTEIIP